MDENILTFNFTNWITVCIMAGIGLAIGGFAQNWWVTRQQTALPQAA